MNAPLTILQGDARTTTRMNTENNELLSAIARYGDARFRGGFEAGLAVAERIRGWMTKQPDTKRQALLRKWADAEIANARKQLE